MRFDPRLTRRVRDLILERGRALPEQPQSCLSSVEPPACTPELAAAAILSDGPAVPAERAALEQLAEELGADPDAALAMLD